MTLLTNANIHQPHIIQSAQLNAHSNMPGGLSNPSISQPPLPQSGVFSNNSKLRNLNKNYMLANNFVPRRPAYSTSRVEVTLKSANNGEFYDGNHLYLQLEQPTNSTKRMSDQTRPKTGSYIKNCQNSLIRPSHYNSSECIQYAHNNNDNNKNSKYKILKFVEQASDDNVLNRKSAFKPVNAMSQKSSNVNEIDSNYTIQQQMMPSVSSGTSSTTSSITSQTTSNSVCNSLNSKSSENINSNRHFQKINDIESAMKPIPDSIRSGSVSSTRSIYELKIKNMNESANQALANSTHSQLLNSSGSSQKQSVKPERNFQSVKLEKNPRRRAHLSDNDFAQALTTRSSQFDGSQFIKNNQFQNKPTKLSNSSRVLNKYVMTPRGSVSNENEEKHKMMLNAQRRLSYHTYSRNDNQQIKLQNRKSMCIESGVDIDDELILDDVNVDLEYGDDDIFGDDDEDIGTYSDEFVSPSCISKNNLKPNSLIKKNEMNCMGIDSHMTPNSSSTSASSSSSMISTSSGTCLKQQIQQTKQIKWNHIPMTSKTDLPYGPVSVSSGKSFISSTSSSSMSTSILGKPPQAPSTPKSPKSPNNQKTHTIFDFNLPNKEFSVKSLSSVPPPIPSSLSTQDEDFSIPRTLKNFSHFDIQSILFNYERLKLIIKALQTSVNLRTGASKVSKPDSKNSVNTIDQADELNKSQPVQRINKMNAIRKRSGVNSISSILGSLEQSSSVDEASIAGDIKEENFADMNDQNNLSSSLLLYLHDNKSDINSIKNNKASVSSMRNIDNSDLVAECEHFRLEIGGDVFKGLGLCRDQSQRKMMRLNSINILDRASLAYRKDITDLIESNNNEPFMIEFQDWGAYFYRFYFSNQDHANYLGIDSTIGPCAISIKREKLLVDHNRNHSSSTDSHHDNLPEKSYEYAYRFIFRSTDLNTLRGTMLEEHIQTKHPAGNKGLAHKEIINCLFPELDINCLRLADSKLNEKLLKLDESSLIKTHKIGVLLCKAGQSTEEEMYNNKESTPAFDEFLQLLGDKIRLKGFANYRGGLDVVNDTTNTHSVYTKFRNKEIMFHVSTLLPYSSNDPQQLTRKRHIGNDLVTIIFQEPGAGPFTPKTIRSHFQHIFIVVRVIPNIKSPKTQYSVSISYSNDVQSFGPPLPKNPLFFRSKEFRDFLLAKIVNADSAGLKSEKFTQIKMRAQQGTLRELVLNYSTKVSLANLPNTITNSVAQKFGIFNFGSLKQKKSRSKSLQMFNTLLNESDEILANSLSQLTGCIFWSIDLIEDFQCSLDDNCYFGISKHYVVAVDGKKKSVLIAIGCNAIIGWTVSELDDNFLLYFDQGECINIRCTSRSDMHQIIKRLECYTKGCKTLDLYLEKKDYGRLGFSIHHDGVVTEVEMNSVAYFKGLKQGTRIVKINDYFVINLNHEKMIDILRKSNDLNLTFLMPLEDGTVRRGQDDSYSAYSYLSTCSSLNERYVDSMKPPLFSNNPLPKKLLKISDSQLMANRNRNRQSTISEGIFGSRMINDEIYPGAMQNKILNNASELCRKSSQSSMVHSINSKFHERSLNGDQWNDLVNTANAFQEYECASISSSDLLCNMNLPNSRNYISTKEILDENQDICIGSSSKLDINKHGKDAKINDLKGTLIQMQLELNQNKQDKQTIRDIMMENLKLKQEVYKLKGENTKLIYQNFVNGSKMNEDCEIALNIINQEFKNLNKDSNV